MKECLSIQLPESLSENLAEQAAARLAHKHHRTIIIQIGHNGKQRDLVIPPNHPTVKVPSYLEAVTDLLRERRAASKLASQWSKALEEKLLEEQ